MTISKLMFQHVQAQVKETKGTSYTYVELADLLGRSEATIRDAINVMDILGEIYISPGRPIRFSYVGNESVPEPGAIQKTVVIEQVFVKPKEINGKDIETISAAMDRRIENGRDISSLKWDVQTANFIGNLSDIKKTPKDVYSILLNAAEFVKTSYIDKLEAQLDPNAFVK